MSTAHRLALIVVVAAAACRAAAAGPRAVPVPSSIAAGVRLERIASGLSKPLALTFVPGDESGKLFIVEQTGKIRIVRNGAVDPQPFLDLTARISQSATKTGSEQGLLGLAFHPRFAANGRFFVNFTDKKGDTEIVEFRVDTTSGEQAVPVEQGVFWKVEQPYANHNGGDLVFGPDGLLYVGLGDGGSAGDPKGNGQNPEAKLGKMWALRPERDGHSDPPRHMTALGLRNPWRYSFDRATGDLWIGDVGQNRFEEVDVLSAATLAGGRPVNFGWNVMEATHCFRGPTCDPRPFQAPVVEYDHGEGCSITGGYVYRGKRLPALVGRYFFADYCTAMIRSLTWNGPDRPATDVWDWRAALDPESRLARISSFGEDAAGELYLLSLDGDVYALVPSTPRSSP